MTSSSKTWLMIGGAIIIAVGFEMITVLVWGHPMSWAMLEAPKIVVFVVGMAGGILVGHFWWPARSRWKEQDDAIARFGDPADLRAGGSEPRGGRLLLRHAERLWRIHTGGKDA